MIQAPLARLRQSVARAIDIERQHRHRRAEGFGLAPLAPLGGALERGDLTASSIIPGQASCAMTPMKSATLPPSFSPSWPAPRPSTPAISWSPDAAAARIAAISGQLTQ